MIEVTRASHPKLFECLEDICHDGGGGAGHRAYRIDDAWEVFLPMTEEALAKLTNADRLDLCIGEHYDQRRIAVRAPGLFVAHALFNAWFNRPAAEWEEEARVR